MAKSKFPESATEFDGLMRNVENKFINFLEKTKTLANKIELDTAEGHKTNPLYIEMFSDILNFEFADVESVGITVLVTILDSNTNYHSILFIQKARWEIYVAIEYLISTLAVGDEDEEILVKYLIQYDQPIPLEVIVRCNVLEFTLIRRDIII